ncbi:amidase [Frankia sp. Cj5]|uniref:amidase n=1 Tax=Frankia sp. Cj5 TaxID=2880978 RepID=UPI001EF4A006|nr:amidase [Frankia sp. Cj5]
MSTIHDLTALEQGRAVRAGELSPTELVRHYLDRISTLDPTVAAFVTVTEDLALAQAAAAERELTAARRTGTVLGPLHGVPVAVKDVARIEGVRRTSGSTAFLDEISDIDDHVVARMKSAGLVILGTTNTPEFALTCYTENRLGPPTRNPWSPRHSPGGSSGGSAAAVAAGMAPIAHGTDAGGSVRIPASACGLVGIKPSRGRVSNGPIGHDVTGLSINGALGRTVADAAALLDLMSGLMPGDTETAPGGLVGPLAKGVEPRQLTIAVMPEPMLPDVTAHADCHDALKHTIELLAAAGHRVEEMEMSPDQEVADAFGRVWSVVASQVALEDEEEDEESLEPFTRYMRDRGRAVSGRQLHAALTTFRGIGQMLTDLIFEVYDVILTPTLAQPPALIGEFTTDTDANANFDRMTAFMPYTPLYNITGLPAVTVPVHWNDQGLPIGVMLGGRYGDEATLTALAAQLQSAAGQLGRRPEIW